MNIQELNQPECYKLRVAELRKPKPDQVILKLLEGRIVKFDEQNKNEKPKVFTGTFEKPEPMQDCIAR